MKKIGIGEFLLEKDAHAIVPAFLCALLPVFGFRIGSPIAAIILGLVTLQKGAKSGAWVLAWVALPAIALLVLRDVGLFDIFLLRCILIWALAVLLHRYCNWNLLIEGIVYIGVLLVFLLHFTVHGIQHWWIVHLTSTAKKLTTDLGWKMVISPTEFAKTLAPVAAGLIALVFMGTVLLELLVARFWQSTLNSSVEFVKEFSQIRVSYRMALFLCLVLALTFLKLNGAAVEALPLALLPFLMAGLSLTHYWARKRREWLRLTMLILMYVGMILLSGVVVPILFLIALIDMWCNFRKVKN